MSKTTADKSGNVVKIGSYVTYIKLPEWVKTTLPEEEVQVLKNMESERMIVDEIDKYGCAWVEIVICNDEDDYDSQRLSLEPHEMVLVD